MTGATGEANIAFGDVTVLHEGHVEDFMAIPDQQSYDNYSNLGAERYSLEYCPQGSFAGNREGVLQIRNVHKVKHEAWSIPIFNAKEVSVIDGGTQGDMIWAAIDSKYFDKEGSETDVEYKSLGVWGDEMPEYRFQIFDFNLQTTQVACYHMNDFEDSDFSPSVHKVIWQAPAATGLTWTLSDDTHAIGDYTSDAGAEPWSGGNDGISDPHAFLISDSSFSSGSGSNGTFEITLVGYSFFIGNGAVRAEDSTETIQILSGNIDVDIGSITPPDEWYDHNKLDFAPSSPGIAGQNGDHNLQYWIQGDTANGSCYGQSIGFEDFAGGNGDLRIELELMHIYDDAIEVAFKGTERELWYGPGGGAGTVSLGWDVSVTWDQSGNQSIDWDNRSLTDDTAISSIGWQSRSLDDSTGAVSISWNNGLIFYSGGVDISINYHTSELFDLAGNVSVDYDERKLINAVATVIFDWENEVFTFDGALTVDGDPTFDGGNFTQGWRTGQMAAIADVVGTSPPAMAGKINEILAGLRVDEMMAT